MTNHNNYVLNFNLEDSKIEKIYTDVLIVGSGIAGMYAAININTGLNVILFSKKEIIQNNSSLAQGGIAAAIGGNDKPSYHYRDTLMAGRNLNNRKAAKILVKNSAGSIERLIEMGVEFDRDNHGTLELTREGGHSRNRILHAGGDITGEKIVRVLAERVKDKPNVDIVEDTFVADLIMDGSRCIGALAVKGGSVTAYLSRYVVLAAGGIGQVYNNSTNSCIATGDGIAMSFRKGTVIKQMRYVQFHPTVLYSEDCKSFLISEAVRGEGALLRNIHGERFMGRYSPMEELAPRDIVSDAIVKEMMRTESSHVYLDITHKPAEFIKRRFPNIYRRCLELKIDMCSEYIPVAPAQHYLMGGIETDDWGRTSTEGLFACGECACTGVHGANRLASNSLLEALIFSERAAYQINKAISNGFHMHNHYAGIYNDSNTGEADDLLMEEIKTFIRSSMDCRVGPVNDTAHMIKIKHALEEYKKKIEKIGLITKEHIETINMLSVAWLILEDRLRETSSYK